MEKLHLEKDNPLLEIADLSVEYTVNKSTVKAVNNLSLEVGHGECVGLVGETGAGKTTTALAVMRLVPNPPGKIVSGSIKFEGEDLLGVSEKKMRSIRGSSISGPNDLPESYLTGRRSDHGDHPAARKNFEKGRYSQSPKDAGDGRNPSRTL